MHGATRLARPVLGLVLLASLTAIPARAASGAVTAHQSNPAAIVPFTGTAVRTWIASDFEMPAKAVNDLGKNEQTETFAVRDATHWRVDLHVSAPAIDSYDQTIAANGQQAITYSTLFNRAAALADGSGPSSALLGSLLQSNAPLGTSVAQYIGTLKLNTRLTVRALGQEQVAGQQADVFQIAPLGWMSTGSCTGPKNCATKEKGYGSATLWLDHQYGIVLRYETRGMPKQSGGPRSYRYIVTSISFGQGPSDAALTYTPPVPVTDLPQDQTGQESGGGAGPGATFQAPPGFVDVQTPITNGTSMELRGAAYGSEWLSDGMSTAEGLFRGTSNQGFVYLKERIRALGLPAALTSGPPQTAGSCRVWTGTFPDGLQWLAMTRDKVAILVVANKLTANELRQYAAAGICAAPIVPPPSKDEIENTALDRLEVEIDITRQILGSVIASAPTAGDKQTLSAFDARLEAFDRAVFRIRHRADPQASYSPPSFPSAKKGSFADMVSALHGEMGAAQHMLVAAEAAVQSPADRQTLEKEGAVFDDLIRAVDAMVKA